MISCHCWKILSFFLFFALLDVIFCERFCSISINFISNLFWVSNFCSSLYKVFFAMGCSWRGQPCFCFINWSTGSVPITLFIICLIKCIKKSVGVLVSHICYALYKGWESVWWVICNSSLLLFGCCLAFWKVAYTKFWNAALAESH